MSFNWWHFVDLEMNEGMAILIGKIDSALSDEPFHAWFFSWCNFCIKIEVCILHLFIIFNSGIFTEMHWTLTHLISYITCVLFNFSIKYVQRCVVTLLFSINVLSHLYGLALVRIGIVELHFSVIILSCISYFCGFIPAQTCWSNVVTVFKNIARFCRVFGFHSDPKVSEILQNHFTSGIENTDNRLRFCWFLE